MSDWLREEIEYRLYGRDSFIIKLYVMKIILLLAAVTAEFTVYSFRLGSMPPGKYRVFALQGVLLSCNLVGMYLGIRSHKPLSFNMAMMESWNLLNCLLIGGSALAPESIHAIFMLYMIRPEIFVEDLPMMTILSAIAGGMCVFALFPCLKYRGRILLVSGSEICYINALGFRKHCHIFDIASVRYLDGYMAKNSAGKALFYFEDNMLGYDEFLEYIPALAKMVKEAYQTRFLDEEDQSGLLPEWEEERLRKCRRTARWVAYTLIMIEVLVELFFFWQMWEGHLAIYHFELISCLLALMTIVPYIWGFHEILIGDYTDLGRNVFNRMDQKARRRYQSTHATLTPFMVPIMLNLILEISLLDGVTYTAGLWMNLPFIIGITGLVTFFTRLVIGKTRKAFLAAVASMVMLSSFLLPNAVFINLARNADFYPAEIIDMQITESSDDQINYYATVLLRNGKRQDFKISYDVYCDLYYRGGYYVREMESICGVKFAELVRFYPSLP